MLGVMAMVLAGRMGRCGTRRGWLVRRHGHFHIPHGALAHVPHSTRRAASSLSQGPNRKRSGSCDYQGDFELLHFRHPSRRVWKALP